ncbi:hypothetical protein COOONC_17405, partial [Cooperia oncophora]
MRGYFCRVKGILNVTAENGTTMEDDIYHKTERIVFNISGTSFSLSDGRTLPSRCGTSLSQKRNIGFDERIFADESSLTIDRDTIIDASKGNLWEQGQTFYVEEKRSYDYQSTYADGSLVWTNALVPVREEGTQKSDGLDKAPSDRQQLPEQQSESQQGEPQKQ